MDIKHVTRHIIEHRGFSVDLNDLPSFSRLFVEFFQRPDCKLAERWELVAKPVTFSKSLLKNINETLKYFQDLPESNFINYNISIKRAEFKESNRKVKFSVQIKEFEYNLSVEYIDRRDKMVTSPYPTLRQHDRILSIAEKRKLHLRSDSLAIQDPVGSLVGSFEESILFGRMSAPASKPFEFFAEISCQGKNCAPDKNPMHQTVPFIASHYIHPDENLPFFGQILFPPFQIPRRGQFQVILRNLDYTVIKIFLVPYSVRSMPPNSSTFLIQKHFFEEKMKFALHISVEYRQTVCVSAMKAVFSSRLHDELKVVNEIPSNPKYSQLVSFECNTSR